MHLRLIWLYSLLSTEIHCIVQFSTEISRDSKSPLFAFICMHCGRIAMLESKKCSQVARLLIWSRASANHLYLHLQRLFLGVSYDCAALSHRLYKRADKWINQHKHDHTNIHLNVVSACQKVWACNSNDFGLLGKSALATGGHYSKNKRTKDQITKI